MKALILGATGGCGSQALTRLLERGVAVTAIVRDEARLPAAARGHALLTVVSAPTGHLELDAQTMLEHVRGCDAIVSALGHHMSFKGIWGRQHRMLCVDSLRQLCAAARTLAPPAPIRLVVVSTEGVDEPGGADPVRGRGERFVLWLLKKLLPPHADNMAAAAFLHREGTGSPHIEFCAVRPSDLVDAEPSKYTLHATLQNGLFNAGTTARANVGAFMADLVTEEATWKAWRGKYPHILDVPEERKKAK